MQYTGKGNDWLVSGKLELEKKSKFVNHKDCLNLN